MNEENVIDWSKIKVVIFDVDGTLYTQSKLRKKMLFSLLSYYALRPWRLQEMIILQRFRAEREKRTGNPCSNLEEAQYLWCADKGNFGIEKIKNVINRWIFEYPNQYLADCIYPGTKTFFETLKRYNKKIAVYSDYKAVDKMKAMGLYADVIVASTDTEIDRLKPDPTALHYIMKKLGVTSAECLFIGDRQELDGECAINANMSYLIVEKKPIEQFDFYKNLEKQINLSFES